MDRVVLVEGAAVHAVHDDALAVQLDLRLEQFVLEEGGAGLEAVDREDAPAGVPDDLFEPGRPLTLDHAREHVQAFRGHLAQDVRRPAFQAVDLVTHGLLWLSRSS